MKKLFTILFFLAIATPAYAVNTHTYVCSDLTLGGGATCSGGGSSLSLTLPNSGGASAGDVAGAALNINNNPWFITMTVSGGASGTYNFTCTGSCSGGFTGTGSVVDQAASFSGTGSQGIDVTNNGNSFSGTITYLCVSDTAAQCNVASSVLNSIIGLVRAFWLW